MKSSFIVFVLFPSTLYFNTFVILLLSFSISNTDTKPDSSLLLYTGKISLYSALVIPSSIYSFFYISLNSLSYFIMYVFSLFVAIAIKLSNLLSLALISFTFDITLLSIVNSFSSSNFPDKFIFIKYDLFSLLSCNIISYPITLLSSSYKYVKALKSTFLSLP